MNESRTKSSVSISCSHDLLLVSHACSEAGVSDVGSKAVCEDLALSPGSLMRVLKVGIFTAGKTPHAEAAITLQRCQTSRKMIRAFPVSGGEPRGCSEQRGLPAIRAEVVRFWKRAQRSTGQSGSYWAELAAGRGRKAQ